MEMPIHRHRNSSETCVCVRGHFVEYIYDENGNLTDTIDMIPGGTILNIERGQWHSLKCLESGTILSQCGNFIAMRLTNPEDQNVIRKLFPDNLGDFAEMLPILDVGEGLVVGDVSLLPSRVILDKPKIQPDSSTIDFWDIWSEDKKPTTWEKAVKALRQQQKI